MGRMFRWFAILLAGACLAANVSALVAAEPAHAAEHGDHGLDEVKKEVPGMVPSKDLALWSLVTFVLTMFVLCTFVWPPLANGLTERERRIRQDIADAEANRISSEALIAQREAKLATVQEEIRELFVEARRNAEQMKQEIVTTAQKEADTTRHRAISDIERARDQALAELFDFMSNNVAVATERVIGRTLTSTDHDRLVNEALSEMNVRRN